MSDLTLIPLVLCSRHYDTQRSNVLNYFIFGVILATIYLTVLLQDLLRTKRTVILKGCSVI